MKFYAYSVFVFIFLLAFAPQNGGAAEPERVECGEYSFELPEGFELRNIEINSPQYEKNLVLNRPFAAKDLKSASVICLREKKTDYNNFSLPYKEKVTLLTGTRSSVQMLLSATENTVQDGVWAQFSLLEERISNSREIRGRERFIVAIEMDAEGENWHSVLFVSDFRLFDGFIDTDEYKSQVTNAAVEVLDSIKKHYQ